MQHPISISASLCMVDLRHLQPLAQVALLQLIYTLNEPLAFTVFERFAEHHADVIGHAEIRLDRRRPADRPLRFQRPDTRELRHAYADGCIDNQRLVMDKAEPAAADVDERNLAVVLETAMITGQLHLNGHRNRHADEVAQLNALGALGDVEIPDGIGQRRSGAIGHGEVIDTTRTREMTLKYLPDLGRVDVFPDGDVQPYGKCTCRPARRLLLLAELERTVAVDRELLFDDVNGGSVSQESREFVPLKRQDIIPFLSCLYFFELRITKYCDKVNLSALCGFDFVPRSGYNNDW